MRLLPWQQESIKKSFKTHFKDGKIYLFGSRIDDRKKGGDIDLYVCPKDKTRDLHKQKIAFLVELV